MFEKILTYLIDLYYRGVERGEEDAWDLVAICNLVSIFPPENREKAEKAIRKIENLTSGSFWKSFIPGYIVGWRGIFKGSLADVRNAYGQLREFIKKQDAPCSYPYE